MFVIVLRASLVSSLYSLFTLRFTAVGAAVKMHSSIGQLHWQIKNFRNREV